MKTKLILFILLFSISALTAAESKPAERGKYIYDERNCLPLESELTLSAYLWQVDTKTGYEIVIVFPQEKLEEEEIISWFNAHGVGKKGADNGAAIFVFPDNSVFTAIGSGNDKISVTYSKTQGERILVDLDKDLVLSLLRFVNVLSQKTDQPTTIERTVKFGQTVIENLDIILLWALVVSLILFLIQLKDGFQLKDLILPIGLLMFFWIFIGLSAVSKDEAFDTSTEYGVITSVEHSEHHWVQTMVISNGKTTSTIHIPHTDYINKATLKSYNLKTYKWRFETTDSKWAWEREVGEIEKLTVGIRDDGLQNVCPVDDNSGGKTIGDGVWLNRK